jgi:uncharacterized protein YkwD
LLQRFVPGAVLLACALFGSGLLSSSAHLARAAGSCDSADTTIDGEERALIDMTNNHRVQNGLQPLTIAPALERAATWTVNDLATNPYFGHTDTLGRPFYVRVKDCGYAWPAGENIGAGTERSSGAAAFQQFRNSAEHNQIMLTGEFQTIGAARAQGGAYGWYWVVEFGYAPPEATPSPAAPTPAAAPTHAVAASAPASKSAVAASAPPPPPTPDTPARTAESWDGTSSLTPGSHLVAWSGEEMPAAAALAGLSGSMVVAYTYDVWFGGWLHCSAEMPSYFQTLGNMMPGSQYWVLIVA